jgi:hypothetical protein
MLTITIPDIIDRPVFYLKHDVSETESYFRLAVGPIGRTSLCLRTGDEDRIQYQKRRVSIKRQYDG